MHVRSVPVSRVLTPSHAAVVPSPPCMWATLKVSRSRSFCVQLSQSHELTDVLALDHFLVDSLHATGFFVAALFAAACSASAASPAPAAPITRKAPAEKQRSRGRGVTVLIPTDDGLACDDCRLTSPTRNDVSAPRSIVASAATRTRSRLALEPRRAPPRRPTGDGRRDRNGRPTTNARRLPGHAGSYRPSCRADAASVPHRRRHDLRAVGAPC